MLEIFILIKVGRAISHKAGSKGWPGWPFVLILVFSYIFCAFGGGVTLAILSGDDEPRAMFLIGYLAGAACSSIGSYFLVSILPDRSAPEDHYGRPSRLRERDDDDEDRPRRRPRADDEDDRHIPRARRAEDEDDWRRR